jgi:2-methylcitrate dehydratase PrpD
MTAIALRIGAWAEQQGKFSRLARQRAGDAVIDTLACILAGTTDPACTALVSALAPDLAVGGTSVVRGGAQASRGLAALVNGTAAHALDFDDNFRSGRCHASAVLVPALLAAAPRDTPGSRFLDAYCVGLEAQAVIGKGLGNAHYIAGWHPTGTTAAIGSAAGVASLLGLDRFGIAAAMANATSFAAGLKRQFGTAMKPIHAGLAARAAVEAALMAQAGIVGDPDVLDGPDGLLALYGTANSPGWEGIAIGDPPAIEAEGLVAKLYPNCGSVHWVLDMLFALKAEHRLRPEDIAGITARIGPANYRNLTYAQPRTGMEARFSMHYGVALALLQPSIGLEDFSDAAVERPRVRALLGLTTLLAHSEADEIANGGPLPHELAITLRDGRMISSARQEVRGSIHDPLTDVEKRHKFLSCLGVAGIAGPLAADLYDALLGLAEADDLAALHAALAA